MNTNHFIHKDHSQTAVIKRLTECKPGEEITVVSVNIGHKQKRRLANLGIVPGVKVKKKNCAPFRGPQQILVRGTCLVLGRGIASRIFVKCANECPHY